MSNKYNLNYSGYLTMENVEEIARLMRELLEGQVYTFVASNEFYNWRNEVRTGQKSGTIKANIWDTHVSVMVSDTYGVWSFGSSIHDRERDDDLKKSAYLRFEYGQVQIQHRAGAGNLLRWTVAVQHKLEDIL